MKRMVIEQINGTGCEVRIIENDEVIGSTMYGTTEEDLREALQEYFEGWTFILGQTQMLWSVTWRKKDGWKRHCYIATAEAVAKKIKTLKFDKIDISVYPKMMATDLTVRHMTTTL